MTEHYLSALRQHDMTLPDRAADIPGDWLEQLTKQWAQLDAEARDLAVATARRMKSRGAGQFLLRVAVMPGENSALPAAGALREHPEAPDGNTILSVSQTVKDAAVRAHLYRTAGSRQGSVTVLEPIAEKDASPEARQAALEALAKLGHLPSLHRLFEATAKAQGVEAVLQAHDALVYVGDKRLAKALISWLPNTDPISRLGSDRSPAMVRQCDYALWTARLLATGVSLPVNYIDNYPPQAVTAARAVLKELPDLPPLAQ